jgi:hypothetical protein
MSAIHGDMTDKIEGLTIRPLRDGGFYVHEVYGGPITFAATTLDEALRYIRTMLLPAPDIQVSDPKEDTDIGAVGSDPEVEYARRPWDSMEYARRPWDSMFAQQGLNDFPRFRPR